MTELQRLTAFANGPNGGNPAGVWIGADLPSEETMLGIAADVGYSETVFATPCGSGGYEVRYFSPEAEVPFCGHATIALGGRLGEDVGPGTYLLETKAGTVPVTVDSDHERVKVRLVSVEAGLIEPPATLEIHQGVDMGRPSLLQVTIPATGGIEVSGTATTIAAED